MDRIQKFNEERAREYGKKESCLRNRVAAFLDRVSKHYEKKGEAQRKDVIVRGKKQEEHIKSPDKKERKLKERTGSKKLDLNGFFDFSQYIKVRRQDIEGLIEYIDESELSSTYSKILANMSEELDDIIKKYRKSLEKKDTEEVLNVDGFVSRLFNVLHDYLFEEVIDGVHRAIKSNEEDPENKEFLELIDRYLSNCGFEKVQLNVGDKWDKERRKIAEASDIVVSTDNPELHKVIKEIIWPPYCLTYYSSDCGEYKDRVFKGKVIYYSSKLKGGKSK